MDNLLGERVKVLREENKITQKELADKLGLKSYTTITKWEKGDNLPRGKELKELAELFNVTSDWLLGLDDYRSAPDIAPIYSQLEPPRQRTVYNFAEHQLDEQNNVNEQPTVYLYGQTAAGAPIAYGDINYDVVSGDIPKDADGALFVNGDSMEPLIENGSIIFYKKQPIVENGEVAVVELNGSEVTCKKFYFNGRDVILRSINENHKDLIINEGVRVIGKVII